MHRSAACCLAFAIVAGCSGDGLSLAPVEGIVTLNGKPVADAGVAFAPLNPKQGPPAAGATDQQGHFRLMTNNREGAALGEHRVSISKADPYGEEVTPEDLESVEAMRRRGFKAYKTQHFIPEHYADVETSKLTATVEDKDNFFEFKLTER
jgi:hypothetical protein